MPFTIKCQNYEECKRYAHVPGGLCAECEKTARQLDRGDSAEDVANSRKLAKLEQKPRRIRDIWSTPS